MKTKDVLSAAEPEVVAALKEMKIKDLERHAQKILAKLGQDNYDEVIRSVIKAIPSINQSSSASSPYQAINAIIRSHLAHDIEESLEGKLPLGQTLDRLSVIFMLLVSRKFQKIHAENNK
ncbi:hypothetical protein TDB9533_03437 [Thalassocella blandensis]|nr:hypothetical protein TDB9533_03437 [Thalassocella blandensis]